MIKTQSNAHSAKKPEMVGVRLTKISINKKHAFKINQLVWYGNIKKGALLCRHESFQRMQEIGNANGYWQYTKRLKNSIIMAW